MEARIVPATEQDLPALCELAAQIWRVCYPGIISREQIDYMLARMYSIATLRDELLTRSIRYDRLLTRAPEQFIGFASYGPIADSSAPATNCGAAKLHKLYVHPDWHSRGLGSLLLQHCEQQARAAGARRLVLSVNKKNAKAIAAYHRNGFAIIESVVVDIGGGFVMDDYAMEKRLA